MAASERRREAIPLASSASDPLRRSVERARATVCAAAADLSLLPLAPLSDSADRTCARSRSATALSSSDGEEEPLVPVLLLPPPPPSRRCRSPIPREAAAEGDADCGYWRTAAPPAAVVAGAFPFLP